jgi:predicted ATPase/DNA-binding XRE family transcriptional regulator
MSNAPSFGQWLRHRRKMLDMTQDDLAECAGCSPATVQMIEHGQRRPSRQVAELLARCLRVPEGEYSSFMARARGTDEPVPEPKITAAKEAPQPTPTNLPTPLNALIGREADIETITDLLQREDVHLLTLTGPPGIGKTRLAIEAATQIITTYDLRLTNFGEGVFWVALAAVAEPDLVVTSIARALEIQDMDVGAPSPLDSLKRSLRGKQMLLLLDNFEQVVEAASDIADLLTACPTLKILVTSREALNVYGEREFNVSPLEVPSAEYRVPSSSESLGTRYSVLSTVPSVALFVQRAQAADRYFALTEENASLVAAICARLDGLPLAIELVAARTKMLPLKALLARLQDTHGQAHLNLLSGGARDLPDRHKTLRDAIGWSHDLLSDDEQRLFRRLGVFLGGFTLAAAEAVCNARSDLEWDAFEGVSLLLNKNLVKRTSIGEEPSTEEARFTMLETIREYALERLDASGEADKLGLLHAEYFLAIASALDAVFMGASQVELLNRLDRDYDNMRAALTWTIETNRVDIAAQIGIALSRYWELRGYFGEGRDWLVKILSAQSKMPHDEGEGTRMTRARLLLTAGRLSYYLINYAPARTFLEEGLSLSKSMGFQKGMSSAYMNLGNLAWMQGDHPTAQHWYSECLALNQAVGNTVNVANSLWMLGNVVGEQGGFERAEALLNQGLALGRELGDMAVTFGALRDLGVSLAYQGRYREAVPLLEECLEVARYAKFRVGVSWATAALGFAVMGEGDPVRARELFRESLALARQLDKARIADTLEGLAEAELATARAGGNEQVGELRRAATILGASEAIRRTLHASIMPVRVAAREEFSSHVRSRLAEAEYEQTYAVGQAMSLEDAISYAFGQCCNN